MSTHGLYVHTLTFISYLNPCRRNIHIYSTFLNVLPAVYCCCRFLNNNSTQGWPLENIFTIGSPPSNYSRLDKELFIIHLQQMKSCTRGTIFIGPMSKFPCVLHRIIVGVYDVPLPAVYMLSPRS